MRSSMYRRGFEPAYFSCRAARRSLARGGVGSEYFDYNNGMLHRTNGHPLRRGTHPLGRRPCSHELSAPSNR